MDDKTRILTAIVRGLAFGAVEHDLAVRRLRGDDEANNRVRVMYPHVRKPGPGDLVLCVTSGVHRFSVAVWVREHPSGDGAILRELGSGDECWVANEMFYVIGGLDALDLLEGKERAFYLKVRKAFKRGGDWLHRFGGLEFFGEGRRVAQITIREVFGGVIPEKGTDSAPIVFEMAWGPRTTIKAILEAMKAHGYGRPDGCRVPRPELEGEGDE